MCEVVRGIPKRTTLAEYCALVLSLADLCHREAEIGLPRKDLHIWYLYRQAFYGFAGYLPRDTVFMVSIKARDRFQEERPGEDIRRFSWEDQPKFDDGRSVFHLEHIYSGDMLRADIAKILLNEERVATFEERVATFVKTIEDNYRMAWILKSEKLCVRNNGRGENLASALAFFDQNGIKFERNAAP